VIVVVRPESNLPTVYHVRDQVRQVKALLEMLQKMADMQRTRIIIRVSHGSLVRCDMMMAQHTLASTNFGQYCVRS
jgi:hypothetical protein